MTCNDSAWEGGATNLNGDSIVDGGSLTAISCYYRCCLYLLKATGMDACCQRRASAAVIDWGKWWMFENRHRGSWFGKIKSFCWLVIGSCVVEKERERAASRDMIAWYKPRQSFSLWSKEKSRINTEKRQEVQRNWLQNEGMIQGFESSWLNLC